MATSRLIGALCAVVGTAFALAGPAAASCGLSGYSYAGVRAARSADGISARLAAVSAPKVENGHVAAWVGVGGSGAGAGGADEWLQVGLSAEPGGSSRLYYEVAQPGYAPRYVVLDANVPVGSTHGLGVLEVLDKRGESAFNLRDVELASVFARQATIAIRATRIERDTTELLRSVLRTVAGAPVDESSPIDVEAIVRDATAELDGDDDGALWALADEIARLRAADPGDVDLVRELLSVLVRRAERKSSHQRGRSGRTAGDPGGRAE